MRLVGEGGASKPEPGLLALEARLLLLCDLNYFGVRLYRRQP